MRDETDRPGPSTVEKIQAVMLPSQCGDTAEYIVLELSSIPVEWGSDRTAPLPSIKSVMVALIEEADLTESLTTATFG